MPNPRVVAVAILLSIGVYDVSLAEGTRLLRRPTVSKSHVAFVYANDIWTVDRSGGEARRLTSAAGAETNPRFSPDGSTIAFTGQYDGNTDVYVVPSVGGQPTRLTYHPSADVVRGWTPDGSRILFASGRTSAPTGYNRLWTISTSGGMAQPLPLPMAHKGAYSPDGARMAYLPFPEAFNVWRGYRGGRTTPIWIINLEDHSVTKVPRDNSNETDPMWIDERLYFLSDRAGTMNLFAFTPDADEVEQLTHYDEFDIKSASACSDSIVYEHAGYLHLFNPGEGTSEQLDIEVRGDSPWARPRREKVVKMIRDADLSPSGVRAIFEARGEIFSVPADKGSPRNLTQTPGVHDRSPAWSPDGAKIAWFSDGGGEYQLMLGTPSGLEAPRTIPLANPSFYYAPAWSPDSQKVLFTDKHLNIWYVDINTAEAVRVDGDTFSHPARSIDPVWSPDSRWIAYAIRLDNQLRAIMVYSLEDKKSHQITDGMSDAVAPAFDRGGKYLYFLASTNFALNIGWLDLTSTERTVRRGVYLAVLDGDESSPFLPESDEEKNDNDQQSRKGENAEAGEKSSNGAKKDASEETKSDAKIAAGDSEEAKSKGDDVRIDFDGIAQRILAIDVPVRNYTGLAAGGAGSFFYTESVENESGLRLHRYDVKKRKATKLADKVRRYEVSADGKKLLVQLGEQWAIVDAATDSIKAGEGTLKKLAELGMQVDPQAEWRQMYRESWRINRDFLYDPEMHGADWDAMYEKYEPFVEHVRHRSDLSYVLSLLFGELVIGHSYIFGGDTPEVRNVPIGLLGVDFETVDGRYRFAKIYSGENWNPTLRAPLTAPGIKVAEGNYLLEVNGRQIAPPANVYGALEGTAGKQTTLRVNDRPAREGSWNVTVVPVPSESALRSRAWVEDNRRKVDDLSDGRLAYVYLPNTAGAGYTYFNRYFYAQQHKQGAVIDERFNGGGQAADYIVDMLDRPLLSYWATRDGAIFKTPNAAIHGPKVMIINEFAGSGGDALPFYFRKRGIGPLVGMRTWGGLVGVYDYPPLIDGGLVTAPRLAFFNTEGEWDVENIGVAPDIEVEQTPAEVIAGGDPQLERAVGEALRLLEENPPPKITRPEPIDRVKMMREGK